MDFRQMEYLLAIEREQNITRAAEKLFISRTALNCSLLKLEEEFGTPLFHRINNKMIPTYAGQVYLDCARKVLSETAIARRTIADIADCTHGSINVGVTVGAGQEMLCKVLPQFHRQYPDFILHLEEGNVKNLYEWLLAGKIDFAWGAFREPVSSLSHIILEETEILLAIPRSHPAVSSLRQVSGKKYPVADLTAFRSDQFILMNPNSLVRDISNEYFAHAGFEPKVLLECSRLDIALYLAKQTHSLLFFPESLAERESDYLTFCSIEPFETMANVISYRNGFYFSSADQYFIDLMKRCYQDHEKTFHLLSID